jgi:hypothetical protein
MQGVVREIFSSVGCIVLIETIGVEILEVDDRLVKSGKVELRNEQAIAGIIVYGFGKRLGDLLLGDLLSIVRAARM